MKIEKAIVPIAGLGARFLPISKAVPKEFLPLNAKPVIQYVVENALSAGVKDFVFVVSPQKRKIFERYAKDHFTDDKEWLVKILQERNKTEALLKLKQIPRINWRTVVQKEPKGDGDAILKAKRFINKNEAFLVMFGDDVSFGEESFASQIVKAFEKYRKPILCLYRLKKTELCHYGVPKVKKIEKGVYKILDLVEKPKENPPSSFALVGNYVFTYEIFKFLKETPMQNGEILLANALRKMIESGHEILGVEVKGKWLECGDLKRWARSFLFVVRKEKHNC